MCSVLALGQVVEDEFIVSVSEVLTVLILDISGI